MRNTLYRQMVYWIRMYRTWIEVVDDNSYKEYAIPRNGHIDYVVARTLVLRAYKDRGTHVQGTTWTVPEHDLDKALATYRSGDVLLAEGCRGRHTVGHPRHCPAGTRDTAHSRS